MKRIILLGIIILLMGCAYQTKPNISYLYSIPSLKQELPLDEKKTIKEKKGNFSSTEIRANDLFEKLYSKNSEIAFELGKLPEFQDEIDEKEVLALERVVNLYINSSKEEQNVFDEMLKTGKPEFRKYCSPLQALFWLAERQDFSEVNNPLKNYSLTKLLDTAWFFDYEFTKEEAISILRAMKDKQLAENHINEYKDNLIYLNYLANSYSKKINVYFDIYEYKNVVEGKGINRWPNFDVVTDRLNSPELIDYYAKNNFNYVNLRGQNDAYDVYKNKYGDCVGISLFIERCLLKAGYSAYIIRVPSPTGTAPNGHRVCYFEVNRNNFVMDDGRPNMLGIIEAETYLKWHPLVGYGVNP